MIEFLTITVNLLYNMKISRKEALIIIDPLMDLSEIQQELEIFQASNIQDN